ncbi:MAG: MarR family transcriptional regulator [Pseudomonadota bacterium]|nr:MarR family transcriptional regulator [Pseudomonadota bacterium]
MTATFELIRGLDANQIGREAQAQAGDHADLKLWLRLLACSTQIERQIRQRLRARFGITLPRFDTLAQLYRHPAGLQMKQLSNNLMVTGGNVTGLTDQLVAEGLVKRSDDPHDRRAYRVVLTPKGRRSFTTMAAEHERWLAELIGEMPAAVKLALYDHLGRLRLHLAHGASGPPPAKKERR